MIVLDAWGLYAQTTARPELAEVSIAAKVTDAVRSSA